MFASPLPAFATPSRLLGSPGGELRFRVQGGEHHGRILRIAGAKCSIGSAPGCTLRLRGENIEPLHCLILTGKKGTIIRRNSPRTYLNGGPFEDATLQAGDILRIGPVELALVACPQGGDAPSSLPAPAPVDASYFEQAAANEQRIAEELNRVREEERGEQRRLVLELEQVREQLRTVQEQLASAQQAPKQAQTENRQATEQLCVQHTPGMEREERQRLQEEFTAVRSRLEARIASLTEQLQKREAELAAAHVRGGECADTLTHALDEARCELRELQVQRNQEEEERTAFRMRLEEQQADLTMRLVVRERELASRDVEFTELRQKAAQLEVSQQFVARLQESLTASIAVHQGERETWLTERDELRRQYSTLEEQCRFLEKNRHEAQIQSQGLESRCTSLQHTLEETVRQSDESLAAAASARQSEREAWQGERALLESQRSELEAEVTRFQDSARCVAELERELADMRGRLEKSVACMLNEQSANAEALHNYEVQVEHWQSEARQWQLQAEEFSGQFGALQQHCSSLETRISELQAAMHGASVDGEEQQKLVLLRAQLEAQATDLQEARALLAEEQAQAVNFREETASRDRTLDRLEAELHAREAAWENSRDEQAAALDERAQRIGSQIAQFEAEQAAFARQQAAIIQQMSALEDRVQELSKANHSLSPQVDQPVSQEDVPSEFANAVSAEQSDQQQSSTSTNEDSMLKNAERPKTWPETPASEVAFSPNENELSADEREMVVRRLMLAVESKAGDGRTLGNAGKSRREIASEPTRYSPPSFLDQAAPLVRQETLAGAAAQVGEGHQSSDSHLGSKANQCASPPSSEEDDDESIEQYMNRLLTRVKAGNTGAASPSAIPVAQSISASPQPNNAPAANSEIPDEPKEFVPRTLAPEPPERLSQMRELANSAAKSAIQTHARHNQTRENKRRSLLALISLAGATSLFTIGCLTGSILAFLGSLGCVAACGTMGLRAFRGSLGELSQDPLEDAAPKQEAESGTQIGVKE